MNKLIFKKKGLIYEPDKTSIYPTHAVLPFINQSNKNSYLHFASRDIDNKAHSFRVEIEDNLSFRIKSKPSLLLKPGDIGFFDQHGAISSSIIDYHNKKFMYYVAKDSYCMYGPSPCTYYIENKLIKKKLFNYDVYLVKE